MNDLGVDVALALPSPNSAVGKHRVCVAGSRQVVRTPGRLVTVCVTLKFPGEFSRTTVRMPSRQLANTLPLEAPLSN